ncbi:MAG: biotin transporter BioY [Ignavibacteriaceae bacterium]|jgi:biotin transport system substrate-specific component
MTTKIKTKSNSLINLFSALRTSQLFWIISFTILTAIAAQITMPVKPVPFTLQTMLVLLAGALLGARNGAYSQVLYIALGVVGLPIFAYGTFGLPVLYGPTGGYLLAFPLAAYLVGYLVQKNKSYWGVVISMFAANIFIIIVGTLFLYVFYLQNFSEAVTAGAAIFTIWMVIKVFAAASIYFAISKKFETLP